MILYALGTSITVPIANLLGSSYSSLIPASVLAGVAGTYEYRYEFFAFETYCSGSCLWGAKCAYITEMGTRYAHVNIESQNTVIVR